MITREYTCKECGITFESKESIKNRPLKTCKCGGVLVQSYGDVNVLWFNDPRNGAISNRFKANRHG